MINKMFEELFKGLSSFPGNHYYCCGGKHYVSLQMDSKEEIIKKLREMADDLEKAEDGSDSELNGLRKEVGELKEMIKDLSDKKK